jgi:transcriptional regulator with XRE-family HTH domain
MSNTILKWMFMNFPKQLSLIRKERRLTQQAMAKTAGIHVSQYKRYEAGISQPTLDVYRKIVLALNVSSDMMLFDKGERGPVNDEDLLLQFEAVSKLGSREKEIVKELIDGILLKHDAKRWSQPRG